MSRVILILGSIFCVALAVVVGSRMSVDATALVVGVACGVLASIPGSLLLIWASYRRDAMLEAKRASQMNPQYPPIVVVNPGPNVSRQGWDPMAYLPPPSTLLPGGVRQYKVIGEIEDENRPPQYVFNLSERHSK
ncbi:MAG: hypothetical protein NZ765_00275 [Anaerolineae bacterium]|nr:hypothetical protein [Anaerolineae bacterium]MDW8071775.1 hypothetical protein [Anaerolineae bacterium]